MDSAAQGHDDEVPESVRAAAEGLADREAERIFGPKLGAHGAYGASAARVDLTAAAYTLLREKLLAEIASWAAKAQDNTERAWAGAFAGSIRSVIEEVERDADA